MISNASTGMEIIVPLMNAVSYKMNYSIFVAKMGNLAHSLLTLEFF